MSLEQKMAKYREVVTLFLVPFQRSFYNVAISDLLDCQIIAQWAQQLYDLLKDSATKSTLPAAQPPTGELAFLALLVHQQLS